MDTFSDEVDPGQFSDDPAVDAAYHQAQAMFAVANAVHKLLYGLKYSEGTGMSIAEAIEVAGKQISGALVGVE